jgi:hypothetical protein
VYDLAELDLRKDTESMMLANFFEDSIGRAFVVCE